MEHADTGTTQYATPSGGSKTVPTESPAVRHAAESVGEQLRALVVAPEQRQRRVGVAGLDRVGELPGWDPAGVTEEGGAPDQQAGEGRVVEPADEGPVLGEGLVSLLAPDSITHLKDIPPGKIAGFSLARKYLRDILDNKTDAPKNAVALNAGAAIYIAGLADSLEEGVKKAFAVIESGEARARLEKLVEASKG